MLHTPPRVIKEETDLKILIYGSINLEETPGGGCTVRILFSVETRQENK
jgi:hypothetical protein